MAKYTLTAVNGIDNRHPAEDLVAFDRYREGEGYATSAVNVDFTSTGKPSRRRGFTQVLTGAAHSLWANSTGTFGGCVLDGWFGSIQPDFSFTPLVYVGSRHLAIDQSPTGVVYLTDGQSFWRLEAGAITQLEQIGTYDWDDQTLEPAGEGQFFDSPPPGTCLGVTGARLLVGAGEYVWGSRPWAHEQFDMRYSYVHLPAPVTFVRGWDDGVYFGTTEGVYFRGSSTLDKQANTRMVSEVGAVKGTSLLVDATDFGVAGITGSVVVWESPRGKVLGTRGGVVHYLTDARVSYPVGEEGASIVRKRNGEVYHTSVFPTVPSGDENFRATDTAEATVIRSGVII